MFSAFFPATSGNNNNKKNEDDEVEGVLLLNEGFPRRLLFFFLSILQGNLGFGPPTPYGSFSPPKSPWF